MSSISGHDRGIDGNKKIKGSKLHIITDTMGLIICLSVHAANIHDSKGAKEVFEKLYAIGMTMICCRKYLLIAAIRESWEAGGKEAKSGYGNS